MKILFGTLFLSLSLSAWAQPGVGAGSASPAGMQSPGASQTSEATAPGVIDLENISPQEMEEDHKRPSYERMKEGPESIEDEKGSTEIGPEKDEVNL